MSERQPEQNHNLPGIEQINSHIYQSTALQLLYNCLASTSPDMSVEQPGVTEPERTIELEPQIVDGEPDWEAIEITIYPTGYYDEYSREVLANIDLNQFVDDEFIELIKRYKIIFTHGKHCIEKSYLFYYGANLNEPWIEVENSSVADLRDIDDLDNMISSATS